MQCDHLGQDHVSIIQNREMSLVQRSDKYTFLWIIDVRITKVSLIWRPVIEFNCIHVHNIILYENLTTCLVAACIMVHMVKGRQYSVYTH